jgi:hypothetical protein
VATSEEFVEHITAAAVAEKGKLVKSSDAEAGS